MTLTTLTKLMGNATVSINIFKFEGNLHLRVVNSSKKFKKFLNRTFGTDKTVTKALLKHGLKEGLHEYSIEEIATILKDIEKKSLLNRSLKFVKKAEYESLSAIQWSDLPSHNKKTRAAVRRLLMERNHEFMKSEKYKSLDEVQFDSLPVQGFREKEISKYFDE